MLLASGVALFTDGSFNILHEIALEKPILQLAAAPGKKGVSYRVFVLTVDGVFTTYTLTENNGDITRTGTVKYRGPRQPVISFSTNASVEYSILLLTSTGNCYGYGFNTYNNLGRSNPIRSAISMFLSSVKKIEVSNITNTDLSHFFSVFVGAAGEVYVAGLLNSRDLTYKTRVEKSVPPTRLELPVDVRPLYGRCYSINLLVLLCE